VDPPLGDIPVPVTKDATKGDCWIPRTSPRMPAGLLFAAD
jgi:hypothetical protein